MSDIIERTHYDEASDRLIVARSQDVQPYLEWNAKQRAARPEHGKYKGNLVHAAKIPMGVIESMANGQCCPDGKRYNLLSSDRDEMKRALLHIQTEHKHLLTVNGTPFAKRRVQWQ